MAIRAPKIDAAAAVPIVELTVLLVPWGASNSIFIVSTPFIVERTLSILQHIDQNQKSTKILDLHNLKYGESPDE